MTQNKHLLPERYEPALLFNTEAKLAGRAISDRQAAIFTDRTIFSENNSYGIIAIVIAFLLLIAPFAYYIRNFIKYDWDISFSLLCLLAASGSIIGATAGLHRVSHYISRGLVDLLCLTGMNHNYIFTNLALIDLWKASYFYLSLYILLIIIAMFHLTAFSLGFGLLISLIVAICFMAAFLLYAIYSHFVGVVVGLSVMSTSLKLPIAILILALQSLYPILIALVYRTRPVDIVTHVFTPHAGMTYSLAITNYVRIINDPISPLWLYIASVMFLVLLTWVLLLLGSYLFRSRCNGIQLFDSD